MTVVLLEMVLAMEGLWAAVLLVLLGAALLSLSKRRRRKAAAEAARPEIQEAVALYLGGANDSGKLRALTAAHPEAVEASILAFQSMVGGTSRLADLALSLGFVEHWCTAAHSRKVAQRRRAFARLAALGHAESVRRMAGTLPLEGLKDSDEQVRLESARILVFSEDTEQVAQVFDAVLTDAPLNRMLLAPLLRRHAAELCQAKIPRALETLGARDLTNLLKLLVSWECALPLTNLRPLAEHPDAEVRALTMQLLSRVPITPVNRGALLLGLADRDLAVVKSAVAAVGRLKIPEAIPQVTSCLRRNDESLARLAASVLVEMGAAGQSALEGQATNSDPIASAAATQALELGAGASV